MKNRNAASPLRVVDFLDVVIMATRTPMPVGIIVTLSDGSKVMEFGGRRYTEQQLRNVIYASGRGNIVRLVNRQGQKVDVRVPSPPFTVEAQTPPRISRTHAPPPRSAPVPAPGPSRTRSPPPAYVEPPPPAYVEPPPPAYDFTTKKASDQRPVRRQRTAAEGRASCSASRPRPSDRLLPYKARRRRPSPRHVRRSSAARGSRRGCGTWSRHRRPASTNAARGQ